VAIPEGFQGGSLDFASNPLAWVIFHLTHSCKWIGIVVLVLCTGGLVAWNRVKIVKGQKAAVIASDSAESENGASAEDNDAKN